ncbi:hypothetical protein [[Eubacterium] cellulosolvens]
MSIMTRSPAMRVSPPGMCYYHPTLPAAYVCSRCGRSICRGDSRFYGDLILCPQCHASIYPVAVPRMDYAPLPMVPGFLPPRARPVWGFILALLSGIVTIIAGAGATTVLYANLALVPAWLVDYWMIPLGLGILLGLVIILGAFLVWQGYSTIGGILTFIFALANIYLAILIVVPVIIMYVPIAIGIVAVVLGLIAGLLGILSK